MKSGGICARCRRSLVGGRPDRESNLSEMAHMRGAAARSPRHDPATCTKDSNGHHNLILLCGPCHKAVDDDPGAHTAEKLEAAKASREEWARRRLVQDARTTSFADLEAIAKRMAAGPAAKAETSRESAPPMEKIRKNGMSKSARVRIEAGMSKSHLVDRHIKKRPGPVFGERLKGLRAVYGSLCGDKSLSGSGVFFCMPAMDEHVHGIEGRTPAVLAVMVCLLEKCEVFEA